MQERRAQPRGIWDVTTTEEPFREATNDSAPSARARAQSQQMGEAPVKYELTELQPLCDRSSRCGVDWVICLPRSLGNRLHSLFCHRPVTWN